MEVAVLPAYAAQWQTSQFSCTKVGHECSKFFNLGSVILEMLQILMIIKGLFRRYERWNPVHPTSGAFWGMGIGIGCGVGWGPGFGPEVIGYVGSGCGIGFSVGIMLAGVGIGLPANWLIVAPYNAFTTTRISAGEGWNHIAPHVCGLRREVIGRLSCFNRKHSLDQGISLTEMMNKMPFRARSVLECLGAFREHCLRLHKGMKD